MLDRKKYLEEILNNTQLLKRKAAELSALKAEITPSQWGVIGHVFRHEGCTTNDVAAALNMSGSAVTQLVNALAAKGYIKRKLNPKDKRVHRLSLSVVSKKRIAEFKKKRMQMAQRIFKALTDKEFMQYVVLNKKLINSLPK